MTSFSEKMVEARRLTQRKEYAAVIDYAIQAKAEIETMLSNGQMSKAQEALQALSSLITDLPWGKFETETLLRSIGFFSIQVGEAIDVAKARPEFTEEINKSIINGVWLDKNGYTIKASPWLNHLVRSGDFVQILNFYQGIGIEPGFNFLCKHAENMTSIIALTKEQERAFSHFVVLCGRDGYDHPEIRLADRSNFTELAAKMARRSWLFIENSSNSNAADKYCKIKDLSEECKKGLAKAIIKRLPHRRHVMSLLWLMALCDGYRIFGQKGAGLEIIAKIISDKVKMSDLTAHSPRTFSSLIIDSYQSAVDIISQDGLKRNATELIHGLIMKVDGLKNVDASEYMGRVLDHLTSHEAMSTCELGLHLRNDPEVAKRIKRRSIENDFCL